MAQLFFVETPLTVKAAQKAKREYQQRLEKEFRDAKSLFSDKIFRLKDWYRLKFYLEKVRDKNITYIQDGFKVTIEKL